MLLPSWVLGPAPVTGRLGRSDPQVIGMESPARGPKREGDPFLQQG